MSTVSLAVKYRPKTWDDVVEADTIKTILNQQIKDGDVKRVLLFTGPAGCGKTTNARIFANVLEPCKANIIEINCADKNGVDDVRELIIKSAKNKPLQGTYKVFIMDECFPAGTKISTPTGYTNIEDLKPGDFVYSLTGVAKILRSSSKHVDVKSLIKIKAGNKWITTTRNHLFFTSNGWVSAGQLQVGDLLYERKNMSTLWQDISKVQPNFLQYGVLSRIFTTKAFTNCGRVISLKELCDMWKRVQNEISSSNLFQGMLEKVDIRYGEKDNELRVWDGVTQIIFRKNENQQSIIQSGICSESPADQIIKWNVTYLEREEGWQWQHYYSADDFISAFGQWLDTRVSSNDGNKTSKQSESVSYLLQIGPCISGKTIGHRGGWQFASYERTYAERYEKSEFSENIRVEDIKIYESGNITGCAESDSKNQQRTIEMFDLQVEGHPSFFVDDVLVHNCHMFTPAAQNSLLKILEEPPAYCIFILCTTDPQKILGTILSRAYRYNFQKISYNGIVNRLNYILNQEKAEGRNIESWTPDAIGYIAKTANGHLRDAITLLDKILNYTTNIDIQAVTSVLGVTGYEIQFDLLDALLLKNEEKTIQCIEEVYRSGKDLKLFLKNFLNFVLDVNKFLIMHSFEYVDIPSTYENRFVTYNISTRNYIKELLPKLVKLNSELRWETSPKTVLESVLLLEVL